tara:strand:- start:1841 stop:2509 length:669 start_codon:yes stop_codon:yes gene_type:complete
MSGKSRSAYYAKYYQENKEAILEYQKIYRTKYCLKNKEAIRAARAKYYQENKEAMLKSKKIWNQKNREAIRAAMAKYYQKNKEALLEKQKIYRLENKEANKIYRQKKWEKQRVKGALRRAKVKNLPFNITEEYVKSLTPKDMICPALGIKMNTGVEDLDSTPSLDRLVPEKGYVKGNVIVVSFKVNRIKADATPEELMKVAIFYEKLFDTRSKDQLTLDFVA